MIRVALPRFGRIAAWRTAARLLASNRIDPGQVSWAGNDDPADLFGAEPLPPPGPHPVSATREFLKLAAAVACHSDPERFGLLYAALIRAQSDRRFLANPADPLSDRLNRMARSVRRDMHKMHAFVRFHELPDQAGRRAFGAWFEPDHPILEIAAPFFARRFADMDWLIATPEGVARFDGALSFHDPGDPPVLPRDASHELWQVYFSNIFNPARIKTGAMRSEMPAKYWKNLPETQLIPQMLADAPRRVRAMHDAAAGAVPAYAGKVTARLRGPPDDGMPGSLGAARDLALRCTRCDLCQAATQTVWGEGEPDAGLMIVGEAPGDHEDLQGRPFVGPAGQLLRKAMAEAEVHQAWLTNAVKHFKFTPRGKRRIHQSPWRAEIRHCRWWLDLERRFVQPRLTVALGATAAMALTGDASPLTPRRGRIETALDGGQVLITWHPSLILRLDAGPAAAARAELVADLRRAAAA